MFDVHPPHAAEHTGKGFFIHIATIVIGLCIAVGIEQTVEYFHHRHQIAETREALPLEREGNHGRIAQETVVYIEAILRGDIDVDESLRVLLGNQSRAEP
jgi:hypothetical protein